MKRSIPATSRKRYRRRLEKKRYMAYVLPLAISAALVILVLLLINVFVQFSTPFGAGKTVPIASFQVATEGVSLILKDSVSPLREGYQVSINHGEGIRTNADTRLHIPLANGDILRMAESSQLFFQRKDDGGIQLNLEKGSFWIVVEKEKNRKEATSMKGRFISMDVFRNATVGVEKTDSAETIYVIDGALQVNMLAKDNDNVLKTALIRSGQELYVDESVQDFIAKDPNIGVVSEMTTARKDTSWYVWNQVEDRKVDTYEGEAPNPVEKNVFITIDSPRQHEKIGEAYTEVTGSYQEGVEGVVVSGIVASLDEETMTWKVPRVRLLEQGKNTLSITYTYQGETKKGGDIEVTRQTNTPETPMVSSPKNGATISTGTVTLRGTVDNDIARVKVNDYVLQKYQQGEGEWAYYLSYVYGNMKVGQNVYKVYAYDEVGNSSEPLEVTITYDGADISEKKTEVAAPTKVDNSNSSKVTVPKDSPATSSASNSNTAVKESTSTATGSTLPTR